MTEIPSIELHNGVKIPQLGLGVYKVEKGAETYQTVSSALEAGYRHIDTASFYDNEKEVGEAIKDSGIRREDLFVTTKVWNDEQGYKATLEAFERSLHKLQLNYVDLYLIHWPVPGFQETWKALEKLYKEGRVRAIGVSNFMQRHLETLLENASIIPMVNQVEFHPELYLSELLHYCNDKQIQLQAWSPLARGSYLDHETLASIGNKYGKTPAQVILRWDIQHGIVTIPKSTHKDRQIENKRIFDFELTQEDMERINRMNKNNRVGSDPNKLY
ncbi:aldo/keto reductase [Halobacillus sp. Marseille-Q1614]|uniref:aldo/keto reductase n=1 Tax=Halobacillus sp. Marseille-Q1614 TaxID=2709134 RepID=UPI0027388628|nr:aldo/keto reductase [Halobacillus sp. Marseille-Q1614]